MKFIPFFPCYPFFPSSSSCPQLLPRSQKVEPKPVEVEYNSPKPSKTIQEESFGDLVDVGKNFQSPTLANRQYLGTKQVEQSRRIDLSEMRELRNEYYSQQRVISSETETENVLFPLVPAAAAVAPVVAPAVAPTVAPAPVPAVPAVAPAPKRKFTQAALAEQRGELMDKMKDLVDILIKKHRPE